MTPLFVTSLVLPFDYFNPGKRFVPGEGPDTIILKRGRQRHVLHGRFEGSPWAVAYYGGREYRYEREGLGMEWRRVA